jgi:hypothetical protein
MKSKKTNMAIQGGRLKCFIYNEKHLLPTMGGGPNELHKMQKNKTSSIYMRF